MISIQSCNRFARYYLKTLKTRPAEGGAFTFLVLVSLIMYIQGVFYFLPYLVDDQIVQTAAAIVATWCLIAVYTNIYLLHTRDSSVFGKFLEPIIVANDGATAFKGNGVSFQLEDQDKELRERLIKEQTKAMGQQFLPTPFGQEAAWHICAACETYVPPRTWHCSECNACVLRRDHHCIFTMCCIGLNNQIHFLSLLAYLAIGCLYSMIMNMTYSYYYLDTPYWWYLVKALVSIYSLFSMSIVGLLSSVSLMGGFAAAGVFGGYVWLALQGKTSSDHTRKIERVPPGYPKYSYQTMVEFLGPNPILRILWPFARPSSTSSIHHQHDDQESARSIKIINNSSENIIQVI